jgi:glucosamine--fructose-6-phosphate aminotransferase (isomerizing)
LRAALGAGPVLVLGSGSSFFVAELAARMFRRSGRPAFALAATDVAFNRAPFVPATVVAFSQSGRSADLLTALDAFPGARCIAVTNDPDSPLAARAAVAIALEAGVERAVPATKSVTAMAALAWLVAAGEDAGRPALHAAARSVDAWLSGPAAADVDPIVPPLAAAASMIVAGSGDGIPAAREIALKCKEATYRHAEGVAAGEFRHGAVALLDPARALLLLAHPADPAQPKLVAAAAGAGAFTVVCGGPDGIGPAVPPGCEPLGWIVTGQQLALALGRRLGIDGDAPRGITKVVG